MKRKSSRKSSVFKCITFGHGVALNLTVYLGASFGAGKQLFTAKVSFAIVYMVLLLRLLKSYFLVKNCDFFSIFTI